MSGPLRILAIVNLPVGRAAWRGARLDGIGRRMDSPPAMSSKNSASPTPFPSRPLPAWSQRFAPRFFPVVPEEFVRQNAARFDVVDCLLGTLPYDKRALGFRGLFVARSVGLHRLYGDFLEEASRALAGQPQGRLAGRIFHGFFERHFWQNCERSLQKCDLLNLPNDDERAALAADPAVRAPAMVEPYGLSDRFREALGAAAAPAHERLRRPKICFIGTWSLRKGSRDWPRIMEKSLGAASAGGICPARHHGRRSRCPRGTWFR